MRSGDACLMTLKPRMPAGMLGQYVGLPPSTAGNGAIERGLPGGLRFGALSQNVIDALWKPSKAERKAPRREVVAGADQVVLHRVRWKMPVFTVFA